MEKKHKNLLENDAPELYSLNPHILDYILLPQLHFLQNKAIYYTNLHL